MQEPFAKNAAGELLQGPPERQRFPFHRRPGLLADSFREDAVSVPAHRPAFRGELLLRLRRLALHRLEKLQLLDGAQVMGTHRGQ